MVTLQHNIHWVNNILPHLPNRLFGFEQDPKEIINFEGYALDGFPIIASFYGNAEVPRFIALIKLKSSLIPNNDLSNYATKNDIQGIQRIKDKYSTLPIPKQVVVYRVDKDFQMIDQAHINI